MNHPSSQYMPGLAIITEVFVSLKQVLRIRGQLQIIRCCSDKWHLVLSIVAYCIMYTLNAELEILSIRK